MKKFIMLLLVFNNVLPFCFSKQNSEGIKIEKSETTPKASNFLGDRQELEVTYSRDFTYVLSPFKAIGSLADYHVIAFFEGHDSYESVEAFIYKDKDENYTFRAIMTDRENGQVDYVTTKELYNVRKNSEIDIDRDVRYTKGEFYLDKNNKDYILQFEIDEHTTITLVYIGTGIPDSTWGGMTDPGGHSPNGGLPMMYRSRSSIGTKKSYVRINDTKYDIAIDESISHRPFFIGYSAFFSEDYFFTILPSYSSTEDLSKYSIEHIRDNVLTVNSVSYTTEFHINHDSENFEISKIRNRTKLKHSDFMDIDFNPPLPNVYSLAEGENVKSKFAISFSNSPKEEIYGEVIINKIEKNQISIDLQPLYPGWAKSNRRMYYSIVLNEVQVEMKGGNRHE